MTTAPKAIYRHVKLSTEAQIAASSEHMSRTRHTPNADSDRSHLNRVLIGSSDPASDAAKLIPTPDAVDPDGKKLRRKNSVLVVEVMITASPEWWQNATPEERQEWLDSSTAWLVEEYGLENIAHLSFHLDETTPHLTGFVVPLDPETGHLNARRWIGGRKLCSEQQTSYAASVEHLGIERGVKGSTAKHERVKRHYGQISQPVADLAVDRPPRVLLDPKGWKEEQSRRVNEAAGPAYALAQTAQTERSNKKRAEAQAAKERARAERLQAALDEQKALAGRMRALPLEDVLDRLGFEQDKKERERWRAPGFNMTLGTGAKSGKWFDHLAQKGGGGAIDAVKHAMGCDYKEALAWLSDAFGPGAAAADLSAQLREKAERDVREAVEEKPPFTPPQPVPESWYRVRRHLVEDRALPASYVDRLHELGDLYADRRNNAVFLCRDEKGIPVGAELKGTVTGHGGEKFSGMAPGSRKGSGGFRVGDIARAATVYLVESAIDAVSLFRLRHEAGERGHAVLSTAGTTPEPRRWFKGLPDSVRRVCAFDNDKAGDDAAKKLRRHRFERLRPELKDWNDDLKADRDRARSGGDTPPGHVPDPFSPTPDDNTPL